MKSMFYDLSGKIESSIISALSEIQRVAGGLNLDFLVVGATARDLVMEHLYSVGAPRMTKDIDIAVCVAHWDEYKALIDALLAAGKLTKRPPKQSYDFGGTMIDIFPFGDVAGENNAISWPPEHDTMMSTVGFMEAYLHSMTLRLSREPVLDIRVPTIPGLALMKILAWNEAYPNRPKDAEDLLFFMRSYQYAGIEDRLYEQEAGLLEDEEFDNELASIRLLGRDMAKMSNPDTARAIMGILNSETGSDSRYGLLSQMASFSDNTEDILFRLEKLKQGFIEGLGS
jgi:predicted nucleotidyltransferase